MLMLVAVSLTAAAAALAGPIVYCPCRAHIARRLSGAQRAEVNQSALCGARYYYLAAADACAQQLFMPYQLPVGVVTVSLGIIYLIVLEFRSPQKMTESVARLRGDQLTLGYGGYTVAKTLNVSIPDGHFTTIIGLTAAASQRYYAR